MAKAELKLGVDASEASALMQTIQEAFEKQNALIEAHRATIQGLEKALEMMGSELAGFNARTTHLEEASTAMSAALEAQGAEVEALKGSVNGYDIEEVPEDEDDEQRATRVGIANRLLEVEHLIRGRNRSAPVKRSMTDDDARRVLNGDVKDLGHKEAGAVIGLTYAQVYSARLEYTFKHVHKVLRESGWKNPWVPAKK